MFPPSYFDVSEVSVSVRNHRVVEDLCSKFELWRENRGHTLFLDTFRLLVGHWSHPDISVYSGREGRNCPYFQFVQETRGRGISLLVTPYVHLLSSRVVHRTQLTISGSSPREQKTRKMKTFIFDEKIKVFTTTTKPYDTDRLTRRRHKEKYVVRRTMN